MVMPSSCWAWQGTRSAEGSSGGGGKLRACLILGLHKMSPSPQGLLSCFICSNISSSATSQGQQKLCISYASTNPCSLASFLMLPPPLDL